MFYVHILITVHVVVDENEKSRKSRI